MLERQGSDPDIVFGNWFSFPAQLILDAAIMSGCIRVAMAMMMFVSSR